MKFKRARVVSQLNTVHTEHLSNSSICENYKWIRSNNTKYLFDPSLLGVVIGLWHYFESLLHLLNGISLKIQDS